jgi:hypothetical protein
MGQVVRTWADHLEPISALNGYGEIIGRANAFDPDSFNTMTREYVNTELPEPPSPPVTWFTAEDGSLFFYPFGRAVGLIDPADPGTPSRYGGHQIWIGEVDVDPSGTLNVLRLVYFDDPDLSQMVGETLQTMGGNVVIEEEAGAPPGQPVDYELYWPTECGKLSPVT